MANVTQLAYPTETEDHRALLFIQNILNGNEWDADIIEDVAQIMREAGYEIADLPS